MVQPERIQPLNERPAHGGSFVLYWMQASQRAECNPALEYAIDQANELSQPLVALFGLTEGYPEANLRHYAFLLEGLRETQEALRRRGIQLVVRRGSPDEAAIAFAEEASLLVADRGYTRTQRVWRSHVAENAPCPVVRVESDVVVPVEVASAKEEYAAATFRPRLHRQLERILTPFDETPLRRDSLGLQFDSLDIQDADAVLAQLDIDRSVPRQSFFVGGTSQANRLLADFIAHKLDDYADCHGDPGLGIESHMSPYLHFGQISPLAIALRILDARGRNTAAKEAYLEELLVRRELSVNFVHYNPHYDHFRCLPAWAVATLEALPRDPREHVYSLREFETARTHDPYWNAAMREMLVTGKMHNYMRMYWGKKIIEWSRTPHQAFKTMLRLNNKYFLDGRDPNSFAAVAWCFGKHDRPWGERPIFGSVRYMNAAGLRRKFDMEAYVEKVERLARNATGQ